MDRGEGGVEAELQVIWVTACTIAVDGKYIQMPRYSPATFAQLRPPNQALFFVFQIYALSFEIRALSIYNNQQLKCKSQLNDKHSPAIMTHDILGPDSS